MYDFLEFIGLRVARFYRDHPEEILGVAEVHNLLKQVEKRHGGLIADAFGKGGLNVALLTELLQRLMKARVSLRDFRSILELIATYCSANRVSLDAQESLDFEDIISFIRAARKRHLTASLMSHRRTLKTIRVGGDVRRVLNEAEVSENNGELLIEPQVFAQLRAGLVTLLDPIRIKGIPPVVILCDRSLRSKVARLIRSWEGTTGVLTDDEVDETAVIEAIGDWGLGIGINRLNG